MQAEICLHSPFRAVSWNVDQKIEILEIIFCHIFTKQPGKPMFSGTLNTMSAMILTKLQSWGQKFDFRLRYQISVALDSHLKVSSLFFIAILSLYSLHFFSFELLDALHISTRTHLSSSLTFIQPCPARLNSIRTSSVLSSHSLLSPLSSFFIFTLQPAPKLTSSVVLVRASSYLIHLRISQLSFLNFSSTFHRDLCTTGQWSSVITSYFVQFFIVSDF